MGQEEKVAEQEEVWPPHAFAAAAALGGIASSTAGDAQQELARLAQRKGWRSWRPNFQILMGSFSASWLQVCCGMVFLWMVFHRQMLV